MPSKNAILQRQDGVALIAVVVMLTIMSLMAVTMYELVTSTIGVTGGFNKKANTRAVAATQGSLIMQFVATAVTAGTVVYVPGLTVNDPDVLKDLLAGTGNDIMTDTPDNNPDFSYSYNSPLGTITADGDVDFLQTVPIAGGAIEFASAYDGVGNGQTLGSAFLVENYVHIRARTNTGATSELRFIIAQ